MNEWRNEWQFLRFCRQRLWVWGFPASPAPDRGTATLKTAAPSGCDWSSASSCQESSSRFLLESQSGGSVKHTDVHLLRVSLSVCEALTHTQLSVTCEGVVQGRQHGQSLRTRQVGGQTSVNKQLGCRGNRGTFSQFQESFSCNTRTSSETLVLQMKAEGGSGTAWFSPYSSDRTFSVPVGKV